MTLIPANLFPMHKPVIGLAGGIGSGKSYVAEQFASLGAAIIDADRLARDALQSDAVKLELADWLGEDVFDSDGNVDRRAVGQRVFVSLDDLKRLESIIHPLVHAERERLRRVYDSDPSIAAIVEDCPLLFEASIAGCCDATVFVACPLKVRQQRVKEHRGWSPDELARREKNQWTLDTKARLADYVVSNVSGHARLLDQVRNLFSQVSIRQMHRRGTRPGSIRLSR